MPCNSGWLRFLSWALVGQAARAREHQTLPSFCFSPSSSVAVSSVLGRSQSNSLRLAPRQRLTVVLEPLLDPKRMSLLEPAWARAMHPLWSYHVWLIVAARPCPGRGDSILRQEVHDLKYGRSWETTLEAQKGTGVAETSPVEAGQTRG